MRGLSKKQVLIGYSIYGYIGSTRYKQYTSITDSSMALKFGERYGMTQIKLYPIYKDED